MMKPILTVFWTMAAAAFAQTALTPPQVGFMLDAANSFRPVFGIAGNFLPGDPVTGGVVSAAFSGSFGLIKTSSALLVTDRTGLIVASNAQPDGPALFAFTLTGEAALAYLPASSMLLAWDGAAFHSVPLDPTTLAASAVLSISAPHPGQAALIVQQEDRLWEVRVRLMTGEIEGSAAIPGVTAPVVMLASGDLIYTDGDGVVVRNRDGSERHIPAQLPASFELQQMGDGWIQLRDTSGGARFAIRITENREQFYQLPEVSQ